jgi:hypothetical protein
VLNGAGAVVGAGGVAAVKRRADLVGIFPNDASIARLSGNHPFGTTCQISA